MHQACVRFAQYLHRRFAQSSTPKHYLSDLHHFIQAIGEKTPEAVTAADIDGFVDQQIASGLSPATINRRLSCLHSFFEFLAGEQPTKHWPNPVDHRRHYLKLGAHLPRDAADDDVTCLFAVITDERDLAMFGLMVGAGLRVGEAPLAPEQMARLRLCGKGSKEHIVWLTPALWQMLCAWLEVRPAAATDHLFLNQHAQPLSVSGIQYRLQQYCQAAGVTLTCHQLRHTFARRLVEHGLPVDSLAKLLGHSQLHTTQRYIDGANPTVRADSRRPSPSSRHCFSRTAWRRWLPLLRVRRQEEVSDVTVHNELGRLHGLLKFLETHGHGLDPGLFRVQVSKKPMNRLPRYLPEAAYRHLETTILQATEADTYHAHFDRAWFLTLAHTGVRVSEVLDLRLGDLNLTAGYATVRGGKPGKDRVVYLTPPLTQALHRYLQERPNLPDDHVFVLHERSPTARTIQRRLTSYGQQAGVAVSPHQLRHTLATRLINQGMPIHSLRKLLGHEHLTTAQIYARIYDETLYRQFRDAISHLEAIPVADWPGVGISQRELVAEKATR